VEAGPLRMKVALEEITSVEASAPAGKGYLAPGSSPASLNAAAVQNLRAGQSIAEINVIGLTVEQASEVVDKFLDDAVLANRPSVRIIHGHGTGALRRGLAEYLKSHPLVAKASFEAEERGGKAITVVELRN
jgi:DNA mismatch repair protein MutS2